MNLNVRFYKQTFLNVKDLFECSDEFDKRVLKAHIFKYESRVYADLNFKYVIISNESFSDKTQNFWVKKLDNVYYHSFLSASTLNYRLANKLACCMISRAFFNRNFLPGKFLNPSKKFLIKGSSIGMCGIVGFLSKERGKLSSIESIFGIKSFVYKKKKLVLSSIRIFKKLAKVFFKLESKNFIFPTRVLKKV